MDALGPLAQRLRGLGAVGAAQAAYLSSRLDLLTQVEARELAATLEPVEATPYDLVERRFAAESGGRVEEAFDFFDTEPLASSLLFQWHRARLAGGERVIFKIAHQEILGRLRSDLGRRSAPDGIEALPDEALADFRCSLLRALDLRREADDLAGLRERCEGMSLVTIPEVHRELSWESFLTVSDLEGATVAEKAVVSTPPSRNGGPKLARRLCRSWLRLVLSARTVPLSLSGRGVLMLDDGKVAFCGGPFERLSSGDRDRLRRYLAASAIDDHESLSDALLELFEPRSHRNQQRLRHQLRHSAPFRDGDWDNDSDSLSRTLLAHWHRATVCGFRPREPLLAFLRGLAVLTREAETLAPGESSFREAFQELRLYQLFRDTASLSLGEEAIPFTDLPRKLDRGLTLAAGEGLLRNREAAEKDSAGSWKMLLALILALGSVVTLVHQASPAAGNPTWIESAGAVVVLVLGGLLLRFAAD